MIKLRTLASEEELGNRLRLTDLFNNSPIQSDEKVRQVGVFQRRQELSKVLFLNEIYQKLLSTHGVIMEFGTRWGQNLTTLMNLRGIYEPYNYNRKIVGFDTFQGFVGTSAKDGHADYIEDGAFGVTEGYDTFLEEVLAAHEKESPLDHLKKFELCKGDATVELKSYLERHPETIIAFAYFDFDIYKPTLECLNMIKPHLVKGSILGFDELNDPGFPGETLALKEVFELDTLKLERNRFSAMQSYFVVD